MNIKIVDNYNELSQQAADLVVAQVHKKSNTVFGLATGSTPEGMYACLVGIYKEKKVDFSALVTFNLDEYLGLAPTHPQSYHHYMYRHFFDHVNIKESNIHIPHCKGRDPGLICREYEQKIKNAGGLDLQILGIGPNGHIGFNEPQGHLYSETHLVELNEETIEANSRFFKSLDEVPRKAVTMGVGSIMGAVKILLLASGDSKAEAVRDMCSGRITTMVPASLLQLHQDVTVLVDREAASLLQS